MAIFKTITQGGQINLHQLRMLKQIVCAGSIAAIIIGGGYFAWKCMSLPNHAWRMAYETYWAKFMVATNPATNHERLTQIYTPPFKGTAYKRRCLTILSDPHLQKMTQKVESYVALVGYKSFHIALWSFLAVMGFWFVFGLAQKRIHHQRGTTFAHWKELKHLIRRNRATSRLKLKLKYWGRLPLLKNKETSHILLTGTTGSGKTNALHILLPQIRKRRNRAIIVDVTGDYVSRYYDETRDIILNPLDTRSQSWHPWADCHLDSHYDLLAESLIQTKDSRVDPFWDNASRALLKAALRKYARHNDTDIEKLTTFLFSASERDFENFFRGTEGATFATRSNDKATASIRSVLSSQIEGFRQLTSLPEGKAFSIRDWVINEGTSRGSGSSNTTSNKKRGSWLFLTARADQRQTLIPLISTWVDIAINALMVLPPDQKRRLWFVMDELAALQRLPRLQMGLAEGRKYGGCILAGFQSKPQLEDIYGRNSAEAMLDLFNTKLFFRCTEPTTQSWISKVLGDKEEAAPQENISFGANSMRDGVSLSRQTRQKPLVMPAELSQLTDLEAYVRYPGDYPCTKIQTKFQRAGFPGLSLSKNEPFLLKPEKVNKAEVQEQSVPVVQAQQKDPKTAVLKEID